MGSAYKEWEIWACFLSPILKPSMSLGHFLSVLQVTWMPRHLAILHANSIVDIKYLNITICSPISLFHSYYILWCILKHVQKGLSIVSFNSICFQCFLARTAALVKPPLLVSIYSAVFNDLTIVLIFIRGNVNNIGYKMKPSVLGSYLTQDRW